MKINHAKMLSERTLCRGCILLMNVFLLQLPCEGNLGYLYVGWTKINGNWLTNFLQARGSDFPTEERFYGIGGVKYLREVSDLPIEVYGIQLRFPKRHLFVDTGQGHGDAA